MRSEDDPHTDEFDAEQEFQSLLEDSKEAVRKRRNARAYEIRRHLEDLQEQRRFQELIEDLDEK